MNNKTKINWLHWAMVLIIFSVACAFDYFIGPYFYPSRDKVFRYVFGDFDNSQILRILLFAFVFPIIYLMAKRMFKKLSILE